MQIVSPTSDRVEIHGPNGPTVQDRWREAVVAGTRAQLLAYPADGVVKSCPVASHPVSLVQNSSLSPPGSAPSRNCHVPMAVTVPLPHKPRGAFAATANHHASLFRMERFISGSVVRPLRNTIVSGDGRYTAFSWPTISHSSEPGTATTSRLGRLPCPGAFRPTEVPAEPIKPSGRTLHADPAPRLGTRRYGP